MIMLAHPARAAFLQRSMLFPRITTARHTICTAEFIETDNDLSLTSDRWQEPPLLDEARAFFTPRGIALRVAFGAPTGWRTTARIAVRANPSDDGAAMVGMFKPGTHEVLPCRLDPGCHLPHHPAINTALEAVTRQLASSGALSAYEEMGAGRGGRGTLRYLQFAVERSTRRVQVTLVANAPSLEADPSLERFADDLWAAHGRSAPVALGDDGARDGEPLLHSLWVNLNDSKNNNILAYGESAWWLMHGQTDSASSTAALQFLHELLPDRAELAAAAQEEAEGEGAVDVSYDLDAKQLLADGGSLVERMPSGAAFVLPPYVFRQANLEQFDQIVQQVVAAVPVGAKVVEWYAGVGVLGLSLASRAAWVQCSDINPPYAAFEASRLMLPSELRPRVTYAVGAAGERLEDARGADTAVVDPPRKGLDAALLTALCEVADANAPCAGLRTLVYVSCGFPALVHDAEQLLAAGWGVRGEEATAHILFPGANHIETVVVFEREDGRAAGAAQSVLAADVEEPAEAPAEEEMKDRAEPPRARRPRDPASSPRARRLAKKKRQPPTE